ncbi:MAG: 16S rRNA (guanine(966)-N(2))-methyltransferase RsmD [Lysobacterales bacterium]|nr:MAG: 16S rRNA (guanine(966)-N(2))-methyltransferase RsmD [Xanthomonadales bacterium]
MVKPSARHVQGRVRIIAGEWRGRRIEIPQGTAVRPTPDRVRETVFNWLQGWLVGARCLDLFAGTGVLGLEALSRGAAEVWFVEQDAKLVEALRTTARQLGVAPQIVRRDALAFLREPPAARFDVVFLDPPYAVPLDPLLEVLPPWLLAHALVYVERPRSEGLPAVASAKWVKQSYAGAVEYGLLRFEGDTMPRTSTSEAHST